MCLMPGLLRIGRHRELQASTKRSRSIALTTPVSAEPRLDPGYDAVGSITGDI